MRMMVPPLAPGQVQVWTLGTDAFDRAVPLLNAAEVQRAGRLRRELPRREFVVARAALRMLLGAALGADPQEIVFAIGEHGKPSVAEDVDFNVAHSHGLVAIALSRAGAVGVDVEFVNPAVEADDVAQDNFHPEEIQWLAASANAGERMDRFFRCWTRKEAVLKADGRGLTAGLKDFSTLGSDPVALGGATFYLQDLGVPANYRGALVLTTEDAPVLPLTGDQLL